MAEEGVIGATWEEAKAHPYIIGGAVAALVLGMWYFSRPAPSKPQNFSFSYGPSDSQVAAGTALAIAQQKDQTSLGLAQIQSDTTKATTGDYYSYLTGANNNAVLSTSLNDATAFNIAGVNANATYNTAALKAQTDYNLADLATIQNANLVAYGQLGNGGTPSQAYATLASIFHPTGA